MQAVVEGAEHTHQRRGLLHSEMQMLRRVKNQRRVEDGEAERREDLDEEQRGRSLRSVGETAFEKVHPAHLCRSTPRAMSSRTRTTDHFKRERFPPPVVTITRFITTSIVS